MKRDQLNDLAAFVMVAEEKNFTRAAAKLAMSPSGLSHSMRTLEDRLGVQLLSRTTRHVSLTEAGARLLDTIGPPLEEIQQGLTHLSALRKNPAGTIRIAAYQDALHSVLWPILPEFSRRHPEIQVEIGMVPGLVDLPANRYDAGIATGANIPKDVTAVRVSPDINVLVVASPDYLARHGAPVTPKDLLEHQCINYRKKSGTLLTWDFEQDGKPLQMRVGGSYVFNDADMIIASTLAGHGLAYCFEHIIARYVEAGALVPVLRQWCPTISGYHLYHSNRRYVPPTLSALIDTLIKHRGRHGHCGAIPVTEPALHN